MIKELVHIFRDSVNSFEGEKKNEKVLALLRHHPFTILVKIAFFLLAGAIPLLAAIVFWPWLAEHNLARIVLFVLSAWWLALWLGVFHALTIYTLDTVIVTNERLIDNDQLGLFNRRVSELDNDRIQDVSAHTNGFLETFLDFGNVTVQTAGSDKHFVFYKVPRPEEVKNIIMEMAETRPSGIKMPSI